ncbi:hypothetical protein RJT34_17756 [Clitoria ternatea]|uniref:Uncharacterized protein n=1 Tax=Clitoria ternatea TaxID=43366 RepID=A0AAN9PET0_CLITE
MKAMYITCRCCLRVWERLAVAYNGDDGKDSSQWLADDVNITNILRKGKGLFPYSIPNLDPNGYKLKDVLRQVIGVFGRSNHIK